MDVTHKSSSPPALASNIAIELAHLLEDLQLENIIVLDISSSSWADFLILTTYTSEVQAKAAITEVKAILYGYGKQIQTALKTTQSSWFVVDAYDIVIHFLNKEERQFYALEERWQKARQIYSAVSSN